MALVIEGLRRPWVFAAALGLACSKRPPPPERTEPWPARPSSAPATTQSSVVRYVLSSASLVTFEVPGREAVPTGTFPVVRGQIDLDLRDFSRTRGYVSVDVASVIMQASPDPALQTRYTAQARDWLDVGSSKPEAPLSRLRWARFTLTELDQLSPDAGAGEIRTIDFSAKGELSLHGFKMDSSTALRAEFRYSGPETPGARPKRLVIRNLRPLVVSLKAHAIEPRDSAGVLIARDIKLLGGKVGHEARVWLDLVAEPQPRTQ